jgi:hypothetical protein
VWSDYGPELRAPVGRVHWAGTETATIWNGYIDGAVRSGSRAAAEVLDALGTLTTPPAEPQGPVVSGPERAPAPVSGRALPATGAGVVGAVGAAVLAAGAVVAKGRLSEL